MNQVEKQDTVAVSLVGTLDNGTVFETATVSEPRIIKIGEQETPQAIQRIILGMQVGEMRKIRIEPEEGFGIRRKDLLHTIPKQKFTDKIEPKVGMLLSMNVERDGVNHQVPATIVEIKTDSIIIDYNHPLAGHPLNYELTVVNITKG
ncbi:MAG: FKBP-type peptidyl-prolyl cis-trans isomerase [Proteobacteria bacterium]|nr:FKBP-type peptidyl-prolyl cis-trans isomerase [Pseudomonadota bacterium]MBU1231464.1 FKBP-type peptidyl-prolyl cis-trans isomerase [Pseudomonadota bacterium]MBU1417004.1 FKBP-type peptidyl-prolyl cis-trans isomerase [Pseudomonadota bacterium]MBU1453700.1 FKBP-type peptidyl-prolyl cis-trans isomerase [Pseudomonadota bacterium]